MSTTPSKLVAVELFAGVGGFALGLESALRSFSPDEGWRWDQGAGGWQVAWANQWEPSSRTQHAAVGYRARLPEDPTPGAARHQLVDADIDVALDLNLATEEGRDPRVALDRLVDHALEAHVPARGTTVDRHRAAIGRAAAWAGRPLPDHIDLLVGGFPCQDYSVAKTLKQASGIVGRKGVLWWQIERILRHRRPAHVILENVDRLLKSPTAERGRDFAIMLATFAFHGYEVEWRVINAAHYGFPQRRRRVFIYARHVGPSAATPELLPAAEDVLGRTGLFAEAFPCVLGEVRAVDDLVNGDGVKDPKRLTDTWGPRATSPWTQAGYMRAGQVVTAHLDAPTDRDPIPLGGHAHTLGEMLLDARHVLKDRDLDRFLVPAAQLDLDSPPGSSRRGTWHYLKGPKADPRVSATGHVYSYTEGGVAFPEPLDRPARTIVTGEGGSSPSRFKLVVSQAVPDELLAGELPRAVTDAIVDDDGRQVVYRRLTPIELERLNMFPDGWTEPVGSDNRRAFTMGNALVVGIVERLGATLAARVHEGR